MRRGPVKANCNRTSQASLICLLKEKFLSVTSVESRIWRGGTALAPRKRKNVPDLRRSSPTGHGTRDTNKTIPQARQAPAETPRPPSTHYSLFTTHYPGRYPHLVSTARSSVPSIALRLTEHRPRATIKTTPRAPQPGMPSRAFPLLTAPHSRLTPPPINSYQINHLQFILDK